MWAAPLEFVYAESSEHYEKFLVIGPTQRC